MDDTGEQSGAERQYLVSRVKALAEALESSAVDEIELTENGTHIRIHRRLYAPAAGAAMSAAHLTGATAQPVRVRRAGQGSVPALRSPDAPAPGIAVVAPLTGVFYTSPSPSSAPFVQVGDVIQPGQVVCILEAMKVFNEIKAEVGGTVGAILPKSGQLVQKGDALIRITPV